jgi:iron complex outermembrane receptor protein
MGLLQENHFLIGKYQKISLSNWLQQNERQLPPLQFNSISKQAQLDAFFRTTLQWQYIKEKTALFFRAANFIDELDYQDSIASIYAKSKSVQQIAEFDYSRRLNKCVAFTGGINATIQHAKNNNYNHSLNRYSIYSSLKLNCPNKTFQAKLDARKEYIPSKNLQPFIWNAGLEWKPLNWFKIYANTGKVFRLPTLNDWYWQPGGNPELKHEEGLSHEIGTGINFVKKEFSIQNTFSFFQRNLSNWIIWLPVNGYIWSPQNLLQVNSNGIETESVITWQKEKIKIKCLVNTNYVVSHNVKSVNENDESINRQLIYTPMYSGSGTILFTYLNFTLLYNTSYTGYRYTSSDNYEYLQPYWLTNLSFNYQTKIAKHMAVFFVRCNNVLNENYQVVKNYTTPLRNYNFGIQLNLNYNKHETNNYAN